jgi:site-specific DNA-methyltransferase (adenine-specific)
MAYPDYEAARDDPAYVPYNPVPCTILDPFAGSGTTGLVAYEHGREFIGIELSPDYCRMAEKRIAKATAQGKLF